LDSIYISFEKGKDVAMKQIKEARSKLSSGVEFDKVSKEYSQAPSVGTLEQGQMVASIDKEVFSLKQGELSQPLVVENGVYLFKVNGITQGANQSLTDVKEDVYNKLFQQEFQDKFKIWIEKLRSKAYVEIRG
jgi:parvulin-like peptidyl-prolyl isomerase